MTKYAGRYFLQYGAPGTEFSGYADGVYVGEHPFGPFRYQPHNPFSYKLGGFARGAGHGSTFRDNEGRWWHVATLAINVKNNFERRIGMWPTEFDGDTLLTTNTSYGDFPSYLPGSGKRGFTGWMILNYGKPVTVSSTLGGYEPNLAVDEDIRTYWSAASGREGEWLQSDLGTVSAIRAIQVNYADQNAAFLGKQAGIFHQYLITASIDGKKWETIVDKRKNRRDVPNDYVELPRPVQGRFVRIANMHVPTGTFALSGFRVFGRGSGAAPDSVKNLIVLRGASDPRNAWIKWRQSDDAVGYTIYTGAMPGKLYHAITLYGANEYFFFGMDSNRPWYFQIEAFNENGIGPRTDVVASDVPPQNR
jgi:hypothetical protein